MNWDDFQHHIEINLTHQISLATRDEEDLWALIQEKRRARYRWQRSRLPANKSEFSGLTNGLKKELINFKKDRFHSHMIRGNEWYYFRFYFRWLSMGNNKTSTKTLYDTFPILTNNTQYNTNNTCNTLAQTDINKGKVFTDYLENNFHPHDDVWDDWNMLREMKYGKNMVRNGMWYMVFGMWYEYHIFHITYFTM